MTKSRKTPEKSPLVELLLCFFTGMFGGHKFYMGKTGMGVLYLFTGGLLLIGYYVDLIMLLIKYVKLLLSKKNDQSQKASDVPITNSTHSAGNDVAESCSIAQAGREDMIYVMNPKTMVLHRRTCPYAQKTFTENKYRIDSRSAAMSVGYKPCKYCKP